MEHPITEEITGIDLVEQMILIAAGYPLKFKQSDIKINGHAAEYRVYAEDPSRKFLPSIGFLQKYKEPTPHEHIRIDTGVTEGSEISMYYDPMISKLITWGKDRKAALDLMATAMDEYVIRGLIHNVGFGRSILNNEAFARGEYTTAFIPTYYPTGFKGDPLSTEDHKQLALSAHFFRNLYNNLGSTENKEQDTYFVTIKGDDKDLDLKVHRLPKNKYEITELATGTTSTHEASDFDLDYGTLLRFKQDGSGRLVQFVSAKENLYFNFYYKGNSLQVAVYDHKQFALKGHMAVPKKLDVTRNVISPMPGSIVSVSVEAG